MKRTVAIRIVLALGLGLTLTALCLSLNPGSALSKAPAAELHVCPAGCPYSSIQAAVDAASEGDLIKVATGVYTDMSVRPRNDVTTTGAITQVVYISKTVTVQGGYTTTNWTEPYPITQPTTLDAQGQGRVLYITGSISPTIEGLRITGGNATGLGGYASADAGGGVYVITATTNLNNNQVFNNAAPYGGGLYLYNNAAIISRNVISTNNATQGGGTYLHESSATLDRNTITANTTPSYMGTGGGLFLDSSSATLRGNTISSNTSEDGGGLFLSFSNDILTGNIVMSNTASYGGGGLFQNYGSPTLDGNTFTGNTAFNYGGGLFLEIGTPTLRNNTVVSNTVYANGGGLAIYDSNATLDGNTIAFNMASAVYANGGGVYLHASPITITRNLIFANTSQGSGGGLYFDQSAAEFDRNLVTSNMANTSGGGLFLNFSNAMLINNVVADNQANSAGSGLYLQESSSRLLHTTIARNSGGDGSGVHIASGTSNITLTNTILVSHTTGITVSAGTTSALDGILLFDNGANTGGTGAITITNAITGAPAFALDGYHLTSSSAAIDAGTDADIMVDIDGDPRPAAFGFDLGADERLGTSLYLKKTASSFWLNPGQIVTYVLDITSIGANAATDVWLTDTLPLLQESVVITTSQGNCTLIAGWGGGVTCNLGTLGLGESTRVTLAAQVTTLLSVQLPWPMRNTAWVTATEASNATYADTMLQNCHARLNDGAEYSSVQTAIDASTLTSDVVKVAGYCTGVTSRAGISQLLYLSKTLTLQGGWDISFTQQNPISYPTTLDARGQGRVLHITGDISPAIEGFGITGGSGFNSAGGVYVLSATATLSNNQVFGNTARNRGGGLYLVLSASKLSGNAVFSNTATNYHSDGGGVGLFESAATLSGNTIFSNSAYQGGGLFLESSNATLDANVVSTNTAQWDGGGLYLTDSAATLTRNTIVSNRARSLEGSYGGGGLYAANSDATLNGNVISSNQAQSGGGLYLYDSDAILSRSTVTANTGWRYGGGVYLSFSNAVLINTVVADNQATWYGAGVYTEGRQPRLLHTTIARNTGGDGSGVYLAGPSVANVALTNAIIVSQTAGMVVWWSGNTITTDGILWFCNGANTNGAGTITVTHAITGDPAFAPDGYHLTATSAAIDQGMDAGVTTDIDGEHRPVGTSFDLGADEFLASLTVTKQVSSDLVQAGSQLTYMLQATNTSNVDLHTTITDTLPAHVTPTGILTWTPTITAPNGVWSQQVVVTVEMGYAGPLTNAVQVTTLEGATGIYTTTAQAQITPMLQITKYADATSVQAGSPLTYTLFATNTGNVDLHATITDTLPAHVTPSGLLTWTPTITAPGGIWSQQVIVAVEQGYTGTLTNNVQVTTIEGAMGADSITVHARGYRIYLPLVLR